MDRSNKKFKILYKCITANTSAIWQHAAHTIDQHTSPSCQTGVIQKSLSLNENYWRIFWKKFRRKDQQAEKDNTERSMSTTLLSEPDNYSMWPSDWSHFSHHFNVHYFSMWWCYCTVLFCLKMFYSVEPNTDCLGQLVSRPWLCLGDVVND